MAKTLEMVCSVGRKVNDGNYGSIEFVSVEKISLDAGEDPEVAYEHLRSRVTARVMREMTSRGIPTGIG